MCIQINFVNIEKIKINIEKIRINFKKMKNNRNRNIFYNGKDPLFLDTTLIYPLVNKIRNNNFNNIVASSISYSYKIDENILDININISDIKNKKINEYKIYQLGNEKNTVIELQCGDFTIKNYSTKKDDDFTIFSFSLPKNNFNNLKIHIKQEIKNLNQKSNLFFIPKNYLKNVDYIKIYHNSKQIKCYRALSNNQFENAVIIDTSNDYACLNNIKDHNYVNSIFFIHNYKNNRENE